jgi:hypothetical protein
MIKTNLNLCIFKLSGEVIVAIMFIVIIVNIRSIITMVINIIINIKKIIIIMMHRRRRSNRVYSLIKFVNLNIMTTVRGTAGKVMMI